MSNNKANSVAYIIINYIGYSSTEGTISSRPLFIIYTYKLKHIAQIIQHAHTHKYITSFCGMQFWS